MNHTNFHSQLQRIGLGVLAVAGTNWLSSVTSAAVARQPFRRKLMKGTMRTAVKEQKGREMMMDSV